QGATSPPYPSTSHMVGLREGRLPVAMISQEKHVRSTTVVLGLSSAWNASGFVAPGPRDALCSAQISVATSEVESLVYRGIFSLPNDTGCQHDRCATGVVEPEGRVELAILARPT